MKMYYVLRYGSLYLYNTAIVDIENGIVEMVISETKADKYETYESAYEVLKELENQKLKFEIEPILEWSK